MDVCHQPVFALTKEILWRNPEKFGSGSYLCLFGGLHFEQCMLTIYMLTIYANHMLSIYANHAELIKGSGLENTLSNQILTC